MASVTQTCTHCGKQFLVIEEEQAFLKQKGFPLPAMCPACRQQRRLALRGGRKLYKTTCQKCNKEIVVSFDPERAQQAIYCKEDYDKFVMENDPIIDEPLPNI